MKYFFICAAIFFSFIACNQNSNSDNSKKIYGSPRAVVTSDPNTKTNIIGPLAYGPVVPNIQDGDTVDIKFDAKHRTFNVTREVKYAAWTFGDSIPGPIIKVRVGQTIRFSMTDRSNDTMNNMGMEMDMKPMQHSIDFHAAMVAPSDKYQTIQPGQTIQFFWTANYPGVFMYHCATPSVLMHISNGMFGMVIVEPKQGYPGKVDKEFAIVQNEYYMKKQGDKYIYDTTAARLKQPTYVTFNGKVGHYVVNPLQVKAGDRVRMYILNVGPNNATSFHVIGTILDKVWLDGNPKNELNGMQSIYLGPASAAIVEFVMPEKGSYPFVDHSFADAEMGATGILKAE